MHFHLSLLYIKSVDTYVLRCIMHVVHKTRVIRVLLRKLTGEYTSKFCAESGLRNWSKLDLNRKVRPDINCVNL